MGNQAKLHFWGNVLLRICKEIYFDYMPTKGT